MQNKLRYFGHMHGVQCGCMLMYSWKTGRQGYALALKARVGSLHIGMLKWYQVMHSVLLAQSVWHM